MRFAMLLFVAGLISCDTAPNAQFLHGGLRVDRPGLSFVLPRDKDWTVMIQSTYEAAFGAAQMPMNETLIIGIRVYTAPLSTNKQEYLEAIRKGRANEPDIGRFEVIRNSESLYDARPETCVVHHQASKDFGARAKRGGEYSILEAFGMNCIHPTKPNVGILVELSRKAPPGTTFPEFDAMAQNLLTSVTFGEF